MLDPCSLVSQQMPSIEAPENLPVIHLIVVTVCYVCIARLGCRHTCYRLLQLSPSPGRMTHTPLRTTFCVKMLVK